MLPARINAGLEKTKCKPVIVVPNALFAKQISALPVRKLHKNSLVFAGTFGRENGSVLAIEAMREVVKVIPDATLHFFGGNKEQEDYLKSISSTYRLNEHVFFHGFVKDATILARDIKTYMIGLAPYVALKGSPRFYADATKIRLYLGCGLPVITTHVPPLGREIAKIGAAIVVRDNAKEIAKAVINLLNNSKQYNKMRSKAIAYAKNNTWEKTYDKALSAMNLSFT
jgi:glycosyltransferase involved in cell wall biosynthesis